MDNLKSTKIHSELNLNYRKIDSLSTFYFDKFSKESTWNCWADSAE